DVAGVERPLGGQPGDPPGEDAGLPRTGPGQDGQGGGGRGDGLPLAIVEIGQELVGIAHAGTVPAGCDRNGGYPATGVARPDPKREEPRVAFAANSSVLLGAPLSGSPSPRFAFPLRDRLRWWLYSTDEHAVSYSHV